MSHLSAVLRDFADEQGRAAAVRAPDVDLEAREIVSRVRRRRLARMATIAASAAAVLVLGAVVVYGVARPEPVPPVDSPSPTPLESPAPSPTPSPTQQASATEGVDTGVTIHPLLPEAQPLEPGMLAAAPLGSSLVTFRATCGYPCSTPTSPRVTYLVTPDGRHFELNFEGLQELWVADWLPGSSRILVTRGWDEGGHSRFSVVDADSGSVLGGPIDLASDEAWLGHADDLYAYSISWEGGAPVSQLQRWSYAGELLASVPVATYNERPARLTWNSDRSLVVHTGGRASWLDPTVLRIPSLESVPLKPFLVASGAITQNLSAFGCRDLGWLGSEEVLLNCYEWDASVPPGEPGHMYGGLMWIAGPDGTARRLGDISDRVWPNEIERLWVVGGRIVALRTGEGTGGSLGEITERGEFIELGSLSDSQTIIGASDSALLVQSYVPATGGWVLELRDPFSGVSRALLAPTGDAVLAYLNVVTGPGPSHG